MPPEGAWRQQERGYFALKPDENRGILKKLRDLAGPILEIPKCPSQGKCRQEAKFDRDNPHKCPIETL
jgi:hypothetical protein